MVDGIGEIGSAIAELASHPGKWFCIVRPFLRGSGISAFDLVDAVRCAPYPCTVFMDSDTGNLIVVHAGSEGLFCGIQDDESRRLTIGTPAPTCIDSFDSSTTGET